MNKHYRRELKQQLRDYKAEHGRLPKLIRATPHQVQVMGLKHGDSVRGVPVEVAPYGSMA